MNKEISDLQLIHHEIKIEINREINYRYKKYKNKTHP